MVTYNADELRRFMDYREEMRNKSVRAHVDRGDNQNLDKTKKFTLDELCRIINYKCGIRKSTLTQDVIAGQAEDIFDALSKKFVVRWENSDILVMGEVLICSPYHSDSVFGGTDAAKNLVKEVLEQERRRLQIIGT